MSKHFMEFNETTDLYLEILQEAQQVEDKKLIRIIRQRLMHSDPNNYQTNDGCEIIFFPVHAPEPVIAPDTSRFWPKFAFAQLGILLFTYLLLLTGHSLFS